MLILTHASLATVDQLFQYKHSNYKLDDFPGYTNDQWGIKAHNRPWIEFAGNFSSVKLLLKLEAAIAFSLNIFMKNIVLSLGLVMILVL